MLNYLIIALVFSSAINCEDLLTKPITGVDDIPDGISSSLSNQIVAAIGQWGEIKPEQWQELFHNMTSGGSLNSIWHGIDEHCSSNIQCGAEACCLKPNLHGKRAITDGGSIHFGSYCSKLRNAGESCSIHDNRKPYYNFHCPCANSMKCVPSSVWSPHPSIVYPINSVCK